MENTNKTLILYKGRAGRFSEWMDFLLYDMGLKGKTLGEIQEIGGKKSE